MRNSFLFKDKNSADMGVRVESPVSIPRAKLSYEQKTVLGSSKLLYIPNGDGEDLPALESARISVECVLMDAEKVNDVCAWLRGWGDLVLCGDDAHSRRAFVSNQIDLDRVIRANDARRFTVEFQCEGWRYRYPAAAATKLSAPGFIENPGTGTSEPLIQLTGSGSGTLMVGSRSLVIDGMGGSLTIDSDARLAWAGDTLAMGQITRVGGWPILKPGRNAVNWSGGITGVEITPRWRDF